ncbi:MAG: aminotransferase class III-fold pyridoxal phosphate-dependent enzyme, partial [Flavobacteriaceae bacterium]|nr:aminotransferase class III-fold pyridoxal phosphate-dependent enzyme [Flavobacteriaceae bacterium]
MKSKIIWSIGHQLKIPNIIKATNCELVDSNGNKYKDLESGVWCTSVGHGNPRVKQTMLEQINKITHTGFVYSNPIIETSASKVLKITGLNGGKCEFLCSGSEAVEFCVRGAKTITDNAKVFTFADSYFGAYGDAAQKEHPDWVRYNWQDCGCSLNESGCQANCEEFLKIPFSEIKTFLFEPGSSSGLVYFPSQNLIQ